MVLVDPLPRSRYMTDVEINASIRRRYRYGMRC